MDSDDYAHPELLADPKWVWEHRDDPAVRIIDCDTLEGYRRAHIPGAAALGAHPWLKRDSELVKSPPGSYLSSIPLDPHVMDPEPFSGLMSRLGVSEGTTVVAYDRTNGSFATRLWWVLNYYSHRKAKVLNGGWRRWLREAMPVTDQMAQSRRARFTARADRELICRLDELKAL